MCVFCREDIAPLAKVVHRDCVSRATTKDAADLISGWAIRQKALDRITPEIFASLEQAAEDIAQGWPL